MTPIPLSELKSGNIVGAFAVGELFEDGRGGMARVVKAVQRRGYRREVALKISRTGTMQEYFYAALQKEVEILQKLNHPGVVDLIPVSAAKNPYKERAIEITGSPWYFGMEYLRGGSLQATLNRSELLSIEEAAAICYQLSAALVYIHVLGFSHNDIKPENVLFRHKLRQKERLEPVLIDFGVAVKLVKQQADGSVVYMAPERLHEAVATQFVDEKDLTKSDVWSMGILLYRMLVGREPFLGLTDRGISSAILHAQPEPMLNKRAVISPEINAFVLDGCLAKDPGNRVSMQSFHEFIGQYAKDWRVKHAPKRKRRRFKWW